MVHNEVVQDNRLSVQSHGLHFTTRALRGAVAGLTIAAVTLSPAAQFVASLDYQTSGGAGTAIRSGDFNVGSPGTELEFAL